MSSSRACDELGRVDDDDRSIDTSIYYLKRLDRYKKEKPYMLTFDPASLGGSRTNHEFASTSVKLCDARSVRSNFQLDVHGYEFHTWPTTLDSLQFDDEVVLKDNYYSDIVSKVKSIRPGVKDVVVLTHLVCCST